MKEPNHEEIDRLHDMLKKVQEPKGYFFNRDRQRVDQLLGALIINRQRYGYMACPCRLACGDREKDQDIICPCVYRAPDVAEFGSCYCNLYVSAEWNEDAGREEYVPERRPAEKSPFGGCAAEEG